MEKVKLMCSYGGKINHRPHDRKLSYVGGDTKILTIDRSSISFLTLVSKLLTLCDYNNHSNNNSEIRLKYKLPGQDLDALVSLFDDEDVENMLYEHDLLRSVSTTTPTRLRLFVFYPLTVTGVVTTPVTARSVNPDFLFGFDKEYTQNIPDNGSGFNQISQITENANANGSSNAGFVDGIPVKLPDNNGNGTRGSYVGTTPFVKQSSGVTSGYVQAGQGQHNIGGGGNGNREQPVGYGYVPGGNREQPVGYNFIPVLPSSGQEVPSIPVSGSAVSYDASTAMMTATSNHESKFVTGVQLDG